MTSRPTGNPRQVSILGVPITQMTYAEVLSRFQVWIADTAAPPQPRSIALANVHVVTESAMRSAYARALRDVDAILPDGMPLVWASRALGGTLRDRCYGPTLMARALHASQTSGWRHYLYGATRETIEALEAVIRKTWPDAPLAGAMPAPFGPFDDAVEHANIATVNAAAPDIVWVGMGCPKQEEWMARYASRLRSRIVIASGAAFDFIAGVKPQAPAWMQKRGLEWAFRLLVEPRRLWKRYLVRNPYFMLQFSLQLMGVRWREAPKPSSV